ncbi:MAG: glycosyltransferase [Bacilli bacterium]|nr:glycosyltransferase [Bacilli bacterium]
MKVLIYFENADGIKKSGIGRAMRHQMRACELAGIDYTINSADDDYTIAHVNTVYPKSYRLIKKCKKKGIPVIVHGHSTYEDFRNSFKAWQAMEPFFDKMIKDCYTAADMMITPTPYSKGLIEKHNLNHNVVAISNGIDLDEYKESPEAQKAFRERFHIKEDERFVMGVGLPFERKGIQDFFDVARRFPDTKFIWFGSLQSILVNSKVKKWIKKRPKNAIMAGYCSGDIIHGAYQLASAMFFPSYEETEGIVVLEALASYCPLLIRDIGVYDGWMQDGVNCHKGKNNDDFERILKDLLANGEKKEILDQGYKTVEERSLDKIGEQLKAVYMSLSK